MATEHNPDYFFDIPAGALLDKFGAGSHKPGSGSAAALMGILAGKLLLTVGKLTARKPEYERLHEEIRFIMSRIEGEFEPRLKILFARDAKVFDEVIKLRIAWRDEPDEKLKRGIREKELDRTRDATEIPFEIADLCLGLVDRGVEMFDIGFASARGDSGAAISAAVAGVMASIFVINLNLRRFRSGRWAAESRRRVDLLQQRLEEKQLSAFARISTLKERDVNELELPLRDGEENDGNL